MCGSTVKLHIHNGQVNKGDIKEEENFNWQEIIAAMTIATMVLIILIVGTFTLLWFCRRKHKARKKKKEKMENQMMMTRHGQWLNPAMQNGMVTGMGQHGIVQNGTGMVQNGNGMVQNGMVNGMVQTSMMSHAIGIDRQTNDNGKAILINSPNNPPNL